MSEKSLFHALFFYKEIFSPLLREKHYFIIRKVFKSINQLFLIKLENKIVRKEVKKYESKNKPGKQKRTQK